MIVRLPKLLFRAAFFYLAERWWENEHQTETCFILSSDSVSDCYGRFIFPFQRYLNQQWGGKYHTAGYRVFHLGYGLQGAASFFNRYEPGAGKTINIWVQNWKEYGET
jgi:hypothetical protein